MVALQATVRRRHWTDRVELARALPDVHRWVEARALLLAGACDVFEFRAAPQLSAIVRDAEQTTLFVIGNPDASVVETVLRRSPLVREVVAGNERVGVVGTAAAVVVLDDRRASPARRRRLTDASSDVRLLDPALIPELKIDADLKQELADGAEGSSISAAFVGGSPIAFCYAGAVTESLWDVAVDTVEAHRRNGHAGACVAHRVRLMREQGKEPVWQAELNNPPSWRLAEKLGFEPIDELAFFQRGG